MTNVIEAPSPAMEIAGGEAQFEELEWSQYRCSECGHVGKVDDQLPYQWMLGTCDEDKCLLARVKALLECEEQVDRLKFAKRGPAMETVYRPVPVTRNGDDPFGEED